MNKQEFKIGWKYASESDLIRGLEIKTEHDFLQHFDQIQKIYLDDKKVIMLINQNLKYVFENFPDKYLSKIKNKKPFSIAIHNKFNQKFEYRVFLF